MKKFDKKLIEEYAKNSTPEEMFIDLFEKQFETERELENIFGIIDSQPEVKDGHTPTNQELVAIINPLIPKPIPGKPGAPGKPGKSIKGDPGSPDTGEDIVRKLRAIKKKKNRLSIFDLEDLEWLKTNLVPLLNNGTGNILGVQPGNNSGGGSGISNQASFAATGASSYSLPFTPTNGIIIFTVDGIQQTPGSDYSLSGNTLTILHTPLWNGNALVVTC